MKIVHISDLHIDRNYKSKNYNKTHHLLEKIIDEGFDHLIISGDITENADGGSFELARNLFKKFGLLDTARMTLVIGNHDIFGGVHLAEDVINYPSKCRQTNYRKKVEEFEYYFREVFRETVAASKHTFFPFIKEFDDLVLIGMNTIAQYSVIRNPFASNGEINENIFQRVEKILSHGSFVNKKRIAVTHHHFCKDPVEKSPDAGSLWRAIERQTMKLRRKKSVLKNLTRFGTELVLHGHVHETNEYIRKGIRFVNAGGSVMGTKHYEMRFAEIIINEGFTTVNIRSLPFENSGIFKNEIQFSKEFFQATHPSKEICLN
jgi:3',5'-cyclic AMP phosphodiesterase CpdA